MNKAEDLTGKKFGRLTVIGKAYTKEIGKDKKKRQYWECRCECGNIVQVIGQSLKSGNTKSCGCLSKEKEKESHRVKFNRFEKYGDLVKGYDGNGNFFIIDAEDLEKVKKYYWSLDRKKYWHTQIWINNKPKYQSLHRYLLKPNDNQVVDHIDHNINNNSKSNLRICKQQENCCNVSLGTKNTSGYLGVSWNKINQNWNAYIKYQGKRKYLGSFKEKRQAIKARLKAENKYFGEFAPQKNLFKEFDIEND